MGELYNFLKYNRLRLRVHHLLLGHVYIAEYFLSLYSEPSRPSIQPEARAHSYIKNSFWKVKRKWLPQIIFLSYSNTCFYAYILLFFFIPVILNITPQKICNMYACCYEKEITAVQFCIHLLTKRELTTNYAS